MTYIKPKRKEDLPEQQRPLYEKYQKHYPGFENLFGTMAHSPIVFKHVFSNLVEYKSRSKLPQKLLELTVVATSKFTGCNFCIAQHSARAQKAGLTEPQLNYLQKLKLTEQLPDPSDAEFKEKEIAALFLAHHLTYTTINQRSKPAEAVKNRATAQEVMKQNFTDEQIEELTWRICQTIACNIHNEFLEIEIPN